MDFFLSISVALVAIVIVIGVWNKVQDNSQKEKKRKVNDVDKIKAHLKPEVVE